MTKLQPTASRDASWGIVQLHGALLGTVRETFDRVINGDSTLSWQAIGALTRVELFLRDELVAAGVELVADAWSDRRMTADNAWALSVGVAPDPVPTPTGESAADEVAAPSDPVPTPKSEETDFSKWFAGFIRGDSAAEPYTNECAMCGKDRSVNSEGYCSSCWTVWNG